MNAITMSAIIFGMVFIFIFLGVPVAVSLGVVGVVASVVFLGHISIPQYVLWEVTTSFTLMAVPLFIFMGQIMLHGGMGKYVYDGAAALLKKTPGSLLHTNIVSCAIFAAVSGSSIATAATIGSVALPELETRGYERKLVYGSLASGGTLGILIPPSISLIIYGALVGESIGQLFIAGVLPGIMLALIFMTYIGIRVTLQPHLAPREVSGMSLKETILEVTKMWPVVLIMVVVLGGIYTGVMTPTECAAVGSILALVLASIFRKVSLPMLKNCLRDTVKISAFIFFIVVGAMVLSSVLAQLWIPEEVVTYLVRSPISPVVLMVSIYFIYLALGCIMDGVAMMVLTLSIVYPVVMTLGYDSVWFGVAMVILIEMSLLTPPVGLNLYVIHGLCPNHPMSEVILGSMPFFLLMIVALAIITIFPEIALWLPSTMLT